MDTAPSAIILRVRRLRDERLRVMKTPSLKNEKRSTAMHE
jgi:hypothetical protein